MKPLIVNSLDISGGAARAAYRLHHGLKRLGLGSRMLVQSRLADEEDVHSPQGGLFRFQARRRAGLDARLARLLAFGADKDFYPSLIPFSGIRKQIGELAPDIVNLHWINGGLFRIEELADLPGPLVWTCHDMWPFTGGCSYARDCEKYRTNCHDCPQLKRSGDRDLSFRVFRRKKKAYAGLDITVVCPSNWMAGAARQSALFGSRPIEVIPNGLDLDTYKPCDMAEARAYWKLPADARLILFGAVEATSDPRKGFDLLQQTLASLHQSGSENIELLIFGADQPTKAPDLHFPARYVGKISDEASLRLLYSAADVTVLPSRDDNLPNVAVESLACGTPVVGFDTGGISDIVVQGDNGFLAPAESPVELAHAIQRMFADEELYQAMRGRARSVAEERFSLDLQARRYRELYERLSGH